MQEDGLQTLIETLPLELQIKVYNYALSLKKTIQSEDSSFIFNMHEGAIEMSDDFDAPLPDAFWLGDM